MNKSKTLPIADHLLNLGRNLLNLGQTRKAAQIFERLSAIPGLPADVAEETQFRLAELHLKTHEYKKARRHLAAALTYQPREAHYHYLMATLVEDDEDCQPERALEHYQQAVKLDPDHAQCWCDYGLHAVELGEAREGLKALRRAAELAPDDPEVIGPVVRGLRREGKSAEARKMLRAALFRNPREHRFRELWSRHQFEMLRCHQEDSNERECPPASGPVILQFVRPLPSPKRKSAARGSVRGDGPSGTPAPHLPLRARLANRKKAR